MLEKITRILKARKLYQSKGTTTLADNTAKAIDFTVPPGKVWKLSYIFMENGDDVSRSCQAYLLDDSGNLIGFIGSLSVNAGSHVTFPLNNGDRVNCRGYCNILVKGGNKVRLYWTAGGASSGGSSDYCVCYEEMLE